MNVTQVSIRPTEASITANRPSLTPELLAASGARYSRNNEGLDAILSRIDPENLDRSVDSIFRMIDYGHQSIADMVPVAVFIDGITVWLAYYIWSLSPTAGGQESSTRYIRMDQAGMPSAEDLGIPEDRIEAWTRSMSDCFTAYENSWQLWDGIAQEYPDETRIPVSLLNDSTDRAAKQVQRMIRNFAFDRARYFLPVAALTNVMLVMSARGWVQLCQNLLAHQLPEAIRLGEKIRAELSLSAPRMLKHAVLKSSFSEGIREEFRQNVHNARTSGAERTAGRPIEGEVAPDPFLDVHPPSGVVPQEWVNDLRFHDNRYSWVGQSLQRTVVRFGWKAVAFAEVRDLNRHRTGNKFCPLVPRGFYSALDQIPQKASQTEALQALSATGRTASTQAYQALVTEDPSYVYWTVLGTQYEFEHVTTADKFIYEAELRTGAGAHFRYAKHLHDVLDLWFAAYPGTKGLIIEGGGEPE